MEIIGFETKITEILESLGFNKNEIIVYLDLVRHKDSTALDISKRTKIHRTNVYDSLRSLLEKGFLSEIIKENKKIFNATALEKIKDFIEQKSQEFELILPQLREISNTNEVKGEISISEGIFALRNAAFDMLKLDKPIIVYGASNETVNSFGEGFLREFHKERIKKKITMKHIYNKSAIERVRFLNKQKYTEARCLPEKYDTNACTTVCGDTVLLYIFGKPIVVIKIKSQEVAKAYEGYFEIMWKSAQQCE